MSAIPARNTSDGASLEDLERRFRHLVTVWEEQTRFVSDAHRIIEHPTFQEIIRLGVAVIPLMLLLRDPEHGPCLWVWAVPRITGASPVPAADRGNITKMAEAWLRWGRENGYRW